ncbi:hypothetical protein XI09_26345 [Bradyrhizobium sp. CCBAU 11386]|uniref:hypothetical protein n=1 Tax=Bradyrhizobium sp. CCBAU 11386 TaxID=1630837 RepID=UPI002303C4D2|nr:hypothetical protein [Bradyrhizobium sp. CCBAU 11386]MDA9508094.1 hypothetical protein [Bradyrhizobium sp. CCBAU 11386]
MANTNWHPIEQAPRGAGPLLLRSGSGPLDPVFIGSQADAGQWLAGDVEVHPLFFAEIPQFDADDSGVAA